MSCGWASAIAHFAKRAPNITTFFAFVKQYRTLVPTVLSTVRLSERNQPIGKRVQYGDGTKIARPDRIDALRYVPTPIHFLRFHYGSRLENQHTLYTSQGSDATTLDDAKAWVHDEFSVEPHEWQDR